MALVLGLVASVTAGLALWVAFHPQAPRDSCQAPCTVELGDALEDEWGVDYGWEAKGRAIVDVYRVRP